MECLVLISCRSSPSAFRLRSLSAPKCLGLPPMGKLARAPSHLLKAILLLDAKIEGDYRYFSFRKCRFIAYTTSGHDGEVFSRFC